MGRHVGRDSEHVATRRQQLGEQLAALRQAAGLTQAKLASQTFRDRSTVAHIERGRGRADEQFWRDADRAVGADGALLASFIELETARVERDRQRKDAELHSARSRAMTWQAHREQPGRPRQANPAVLHSVEALRRSLTDDVGHPAMSDAGLDDWERSVHQYGLATRYRPAGALIADLAADFTELCRLLEGRRTLLVSSRLTRVMAQMAGLMSLALIRLDQRAAARNWARTAKLIAVEAGDNQLHSWVRAQESYAHFYSGNLEESIYVAGHAQQLARSAPCPGVVLAAALEARAQALCGRVDETQRLLSTVEQDLGIMETEALQDSAFGYNQAHFFFHAGNAYTHLGMTAAARQAQDQALVLYPESDYLDRALVKLDRADCLARDNELAVAASWAVAALSTAGSESRDQMIDNRARQVLTQVLPEAATSPPVQELRELLETSAPQ